MNNIKNYFISQLEDIPNNIRIFKDNPDIQEIKTNSNRDMMYFILRDTREEQLNETSIGGPVIKKKAFEIIGITDKYRDIDRINDTIDQILMKKLNNMEFIPNVVVNDTKIINAYDFKTSYVGLAENKNDMIYRLGFRVIWQ